MLAMSSYVRDIKYNIFIFIKGGDVCVYTVCLNKQF